MRTYSDCSTSNETDARALRLRNNSTSWKSYTDRTKDWLSIKRKEAIAVLHRVD